MGCDLIIKNAKIVDGTGSLAFKGSIAVDKGRIVSVSHCASPGGFDAADVYDAEGKVLSPGFIDIHCHTDETVFRYPTADSKILQGVTTDLGGNCGISYAPVEDSRLDLLRSYVGEAPYNWHSYAEYFDRLEELKPSVNLACGVGHGTLRIAVMGFDKRQASEEELAEMKRLLAKALDDGAFMFSSGLVYPPGLYGDSNELVELCKVVAEKGSFYATHMRNEGLYIETALKEAIDTAKASGVSIEISHHKVARKERWGASRDTIAMIDQARADGVDIWADQYPYTASSTYFSSNVPSWAFEGGVEALEDRLKDPETKVRILHDMDESHLGRWQDIVLGYTAAEEFRQYMGKDMITIGKLMGCTPSEASVMIVLADANNAFEINYGMCEDDIEYIMKQPYVSIGSDGWAYSMDYPGLPHPRCYGTFPRVISHYSRDRKLFPLETAIYKMTGLPAGRIGLKDRGVIKAGNYADLTVFDPLTIKDDPTYDEPEKPCSGIARVYVNGVLTAKDGVHTGARAGQIIRR